MNVAQAGVEELIVGDWRVSAPPPTGSPGGDAEPHSAPRLSVIITYFLGQQTVGDAVRSVLAQTVQPHEIVICDDGSQTPENSAGNVGTIVRYNISENDRTRGINVAGPVKGSLIYNNTFYVGKRDRVDLPARIARRHPRRSAARR